MASLFNLDMLSVGITVAAIGILGFVVFLNNASSITNRTFLLFSLVTIFWGFFNYLNYHVSSPILVLWFLRLVIFLAVWHSFSFFQLFYVFPEEHVVFSRSYRFGLIPLVVVTSFITLTPLVFSRISALSSVGAVSTVERGPGMIAFALPVVGFILSGIYVLFKKTRYAAGLQKKQFKIILIGTILTFSFIGIFNFILPAVFQNVRFIPLGAVFFFPFVAFTAYAIIKLNLLNVKIFATEILTFVLSMVTMLQVVLSESAAVFVFRVITFALVLIFGIFLIRSVKKEVSQREKLELVTKELQKANARLKELDVQKTDFLSMASHQLRTPITIVNGYIELLKENAYGKVTEETKGILDNMDASNQRLIKLVDEFLDVSRIEQGRTKFDFKDQDINTIVTSVVEEQSQRAKDKGMKIIWQKPTKPMVACADEEKIRHVIFNFVDNALKYSEHGTVTVKVKTEKDGLEVLVHDEGLGFGKTDENNFFQKFYRGENIKQYDASGTGLGLFVCRKFIESHKGKIWAHSAGVGKGSEFGFWIPVNCKI